MLHQLGIPFERIDYDLDRAETRTPEFLARNPNGRIPLLELGPGQYLAESNAILFYLADNTQFMPTDKMERAQVMQWLFFEQYSHEPNIATVRFWITHHVSLNEFRAAALPVKRQLGIEALKVMEQHLANHHWFVGSSYSIADIALYAYTHVAGEGGFDLRPFPSIRNWIEKVSSQPNHVKITDATIGLHHLT